MANYIDSFCECEKESTELEKLQSENHYLHKELDQLIIESKEKDVQIQQLKEQINAAKYILSR